MLKKAYVWLWLLCWLPGAQAQLGKVCLIADDVGPGINDRGFNSAAWRAFNEAQDIGLVASIAQGGAADGDSSQVVLDAFVAAGDCDLIFAMGFRLADMTAEQARRHPSQRFVTVDTAVAPDEGGPNLLGVTFRGDQASFLAGYVAATVSQTRVVGEFGAQKLPPVTQLMDGFAGGVRAYRREGGRRIALTGWRPAAGRGLFTQDFNSLPKGAAAARTLMGRQADVLFPVAGDGSFGAVYQSALSQRRRVQVIGIDIDFRAAVGDTPGLSDIILTSVLKRIDRMVLSVIRDAEAGGLEGESIRYGELHNGGMELAPLPVAVMTRFPGLESRLQELTRQIIAGCIDLTSGAAIPDCHD